MSERHYPWIVGQPPPKIEAHSVVKHDVLRQYLAQYVDVMCRNLTQERLQLVLVDGFAGGGLYLRDGVPHEGSPLVMLSSMRDARAIQVDRRHKKLFRLDCKYFFVAKDASAASYLRGAIKMSGHDALLGSDITIIESGFVDVVDRLIEQIRNTSPKMRCLFLLDQCGWSDVPMATIQKIFKALPNAEIILNLAMDFLTNFLTDDNVGSVRAMGLNPDMNFVNAFRDTGRPWKQIIQHTLRGQVRELSGARHDTPFFVPPAVGGRGYWLIHLSQHAKARDVMAGIHWKYSNDRQVFEHFGRPGLNMLGYDPRHDSEDQPALEGFAFDQTARTSTRDALVAQLPAKIKAYPNGVTRAILFDALASDTPADGAIFNDALRDLRDHRDIDIVVDGKATDAKEFRNDAILRQSVKPTLFDTREFKRGPK